MNNSTIATDTNDHKQHTQIEMHRRLVGGYLLRGERPYAKVFQQAWNKTIIDIAQLPYNSQILEIGCGTGIFTRDLQKKYYSVTSMDLSFDMLQIATSKIGSANVSFQVGDMMYLPYENDVFDAVVGRGVLHHSPDFMKTMAEIRRVLRPGGKMIFSEPCNDSWIIQTARNILYKNSDKFDEDDIAYHKQELAKDVAQAGFTNIRFQPFGFFGYTLAGFPDHINIFDKIPFSSDITKLLLGMDYILERTPLIQGNSLHVITIAISP